MFGPKLHPQAKIYVGNRPPRDPATLKVEMYRDKGGSFKPVEITDMGEHQCHTTDDYVVSSDDGAHIPVRVYRPWQSPGEKNDLLPALVYYHGGGFIAGSLENVDAPARYFANAVGCIVVTVSYRKAPEFKFPVPLLDAYDTARWTFRRARELKIDVRRIALGGESAGGNLAAVVALLMKESTTEPTQLPMFQLLIYPVIDFDFSTRSYNEFAQGYGMTADEMHFFWLQYLPTEKDASDWRACPIRAPSHQGLPPALVIVAECDVLRDDGIAYATKLKQAKVPVSLRVYSGMPHGFFKQVHIMDTSRKAMTEAAKTLKLAFGITAQGTSKGK
mmetsp:Transcript_9198/g.15100  ORF Transcript_9198/g.15100 Transcript_9198/m.15100 type:complete len:332 (+) Transcript_9198:400-1395(+)|eukprot:CAMPEP_0184667934 /NCGR_PEP_ID=MMETSP0308-20130426/69919_1 /TAXON_ID=38269 /ORGANISM="Gloeochaete witrockiana, Strain SAG 46.84" /LENGTH=331 /DNA_ID=CAMNT_0027113393 /DNA_START=402 /DNA_END=1400 /DNA_ORIENTATION=+